MSKGTNTTTTNTAPNAAAMGAYQNLLGISQGVANANPFQTYSGEFTAPVNQQQYGGISNINNYAESAQPAIGVAERLALMGAAPITSGDIQGYYNPWQQQVVQATENQFQNTNAQQQQQVLGNAALQGALGGDRVGVAQANLAGQQQMAQDPVIAQLESQGFNQAAQLALAAKQQEAQGAYSLGNLGVAGQQAGLTGAGAQVQAGTLEQQTQQQLDAALYNQFLMQQAFPYQQTQWLAGIDTGVGSQMGGTSQTTVPPPSLLAQLGGLGLAGVGVIGGTGGFGKSGWLTGARHGGAIEAHQHDDGVWRVPGFADGGVPVMIGQPLYGGISGFVPQTQITRGRGAPPPPGTAPSSATQMVQDAQKIASAFKGTGGLGKSTVGAPMGLAPAADGPVQSPGLSPATTPLGDEGIYARGGIVDRLPTHNRIDLTRRAGFGLGSVMPMHRQEGGDVVEIPAEDLPAQTPPEALAAWRQGRDLAIANGEGGVGVPPSALPFASTESAPVAGISGTPVADRMAATYGQRQPVTVQRGTGESVPWSSSQSNIWPSLMAAGFGMMSSRSPFPGVAIGEGGLQGLGTYTQLGKEQRAEAMTQQKINQAADNLALHAEQVQKNIAHQTKQENLEQEKFTFTKQKTDTPFGWTRGDNGQLIPTPGGPHDPATIRAESEAKGENWKQTFDPTTGQILWFNTKTMETRDQKGNPVTPPSGPSPSAPVPPAPGTPTSQEPALPSSPTQVGNAPAGPIKVASTDPNLVGIVRANAAQAAQPFNYGHDAPYVEKGMEVPEPQAIGGKSTAAIKQAGEYFLQTGKLPAGFSIPKGNNPVAVTQALAGNSAINYASALASSRGITPEQASETWRSAPGMLRFIMGPDGRATVSLGVAQRHLDTLMEYAREWDKATISGHSQTLRSLQERIMREFGSDASSGLRASAQIMGPEIVKAIGIAGGGSDRDRSEATALWTAANSLPQMEAAAKATQRLMTGQLQGKENMALSVGVTPERFKTLIGPHEYERLKQMEGGGDGGTTAPAQTTTPQVPPGSRKQNGWWYTPDGKPIGPAQ
jgi:hypothetical protein